MKVPTRTIPAVAAAAAFMALLPFASPAAGDVD